MKSLILTIFALIILTNPASAAKRALIIAIQEYKNADYNTLYGCVNDANQMESILKTNLGFKSNEIKVLINDKATRTGILTAFDQWLIKGTRTGDKIFIFYAGHGAYCPDDNGDEKDETPPRDETLCPYDTVPFSKTQKGNMILDDEIGQKLAKLNGRKMVVIFDSCHSGTATRAMDNEKELPVRSLPRIISGGSRGGFMKERQKPAKGKRINAFSEEIDQSKSYMVFLSAAAPWQTAHEIAVNRVYHGALTYSIIQAFKNYGNNTTISKIKDTFENVRKLDTILKNQTPQIEGNPELANTPLKALFSSSVEDDLVMAGRNRNPDIKVRAWINQQGKQQFDQSEALEFHVISSRDGYLYLFDIIESSEEVRLLYPHNLPGSESGKNFIRKNEEIIIPPPKKPGDIITYEYKADQGKDSIIAMVTEKPWTEIDKAIETTKFGKIINTDQKMKILKFLYKKQSGRHMEYEPDNKTGKNDSWTGTSINIEIKKR